MPFLLAEILNFQGSTHRIGVGSFSYFTFKNCKGTTADELLFIVKQTLYQEYLRYEKLLRDKMDKDSYETRDFYEMIEILRNPQANHEQYALSIQFLTRFVKDSYKIAPILLIDEYDQPIMSSLDHFSLICMEAP